MTTAGELAALCGLDRSRGFIVPWDVVGQDLGLELPADYRELVGYFGPGSFDEAVRLYIPGIENSLLELRSFAARIGEAIREARADFPDSYPYPAYPEPGCILPVVHFIDGEQAYWLTDSGPSDRWPIVVKALEFGWHRFDGSITDFLSGLFGDRLGIDYFRGYFPEFPRFQPELGEYPGVGERLEALGRFSD